MEFGDDHIFRLFFWLDHYRIVVCSIEPTDGFMIFG